MRLGLFQHDDQNTAPPGKHISADGTKSTNGAYTRQRYALRECPSLSDLEQLMRDCDYRHHLTAGVNPDHTEAIATPFANGLDATGLPTISRSNKFLPWHPGPSALIIDSDGVDSFDLVYGALVQIVPGLALYAMLHASSSSSCIDNGPVKGAHTILHVADGTDIRRALEVLHKRAILHGHQRFRISENGVVLNRSIIDLAMTKPSQPAYIHARCEAPHRQHKQYQMRAGIEVVDTRLIIPDLTEPEERHYQATVKRLKKEWEPERKRIRAEWEEAKVAEFIATGLTEDQARKAIKQLNDSVLDGLYRITTRDGVFTVSQILDDPKRFHGMRCADPEDPSHDLGKGRLYTDQGQPMLNSFFHGEHKFSLIRHPSEVMPAQAVMPPGMEVQAVTYTAAPAPAQALAVPVQDILTAADIADRWEVTDPEFARQAAAYKMAADPAFDLFQQVATEARFKTEFATRVQKHVAEMRVAKVHETVTDKMVITPKDPNDYLNLAAAIADGIAQRGLAFTFLGHPTVISRTKSAYARVTSRGPNGVKIIGPDGEPLTEPAIVHKAQMMQRAHFQTVAASTAYFMNGDGDGILPPEGVITYLSTIAGETLNPVGSIATHPVMWQGQLLTGVNGYHDGSGLYLTTGDLEIEAWRDTRAAYRFLRHDWLGDFPFASEVDALVAVIAAGNLLVVKTDLLEEEGPPIIGFTAPSPNTGKSYLQAIIHLAITGRPLATVLYPDDPDERRKLIVAAVMEGSSHLAFDNMTTGTTLGNSHTALLHLLTSPALAGRILGESKNAAGMTGMAVTFNGNGIVTAGDMASRALDCHLIPPTDNNTNRIFKHSDLRAWTLENRGKIIGALACIMAQQATGGTTSRFPKWERRVALPMVKASGVDGLFNDWIEIGEQDASGSTTDKARTLLDAIEALNWDWATGAEIATQLSKSNPVALAAVFGKMIVEGKEFTAWMKRNRSQTTTSRKRLRMERMHLQHRTDWKVRPVFKVT